MAGGENIEHRQMNKTCIYFSFAAKPKVFQAFPPTNYAWGGTAVGVLEQNTAEKHQRCAGEARQNSGGTVWPSTA